MDISYNLGEDSEQASDTPKRGAWMAKNSPVEVSRSEHHDTAERHDPLAVTNDGVAMESNQDTHGDSGHGDHGGNVDVNNEPVHPERIDEAEGGGSKEGEDTDDSVATETGSDGQTSLKVLAAKLETVEGFMEKIDKRSLSLTKTVRDLEDSLTFSQQQIDDLRKENAELKKQVGVIEMEDRRTQFQVKSVEGKLDKLETASKKKNLLVEGIPEKADRKEVAENTIGELFDQIGVDKGINFDACFRLGPYNKNKARPILISFERQTDRDMIYSRRFELKKTKDFQRVWLNEDMGPLSKRRRGIIQHITKEAQRQGIDCRTGKYSISIDRKKYQASGGRTGNI